MATTSMRSRHAGLAWASQYAASSAVRPSTCPSSPWSPDRSKKQVCHRSASSTYSPVPSSVSQRGRPRRCSSIPRCATSDGGCSSSRISAGGERGMHHRPRQPALACRLRHRAPPIGDQAPPRAHAAAAVTRQRGGTAAAASVNVLRGQDGSRHSSRRFTCTTLTWPWPQPRSAGRVVTYPFTCADTVPQPGHAAASGSAGLTHTVRPPPAPASTSTTSAPSSANSRDAIS